MSISSHVQRTCLDLAMEGERLCKLGECQNGAKFLEMALQVGTKDIGLMSAIYCQLGNAYFYLQLYEKALEYHGYDLDLMSKHSNCELGKVKALGNLGNIMKVIGRTDEAIELFKQHLDMSREISDQIGEARALYNLGNVYLSKVKEVVRKSANDPEMDVDTDLVHGTLCKAINFYRANVKILLEIGDKAAVGRTYGNLGSAYYLLDDLNEAVHWHLKRLDIARELGDKMAERRACCNLGNASVLLGDYKAAAEYFRMEYEVAGQLGDRANEGRACYALGNTYWLLDDHANAIEHHRQHLEIAKELHDVEGVGRAYWSLGNAYMETGEAEKASAFIKLHLDISTKIGDLSSQKASQELLQELEENLKSSEQKSITTDGSSINNNGEDGEQVEITENEDQVDVGFTRRFRSQSQRPSGKPKDKAADQPKDKTLDQPKDKTVDQQRSKVVDQPRKTTVDQSKNKPTDESSMKSFPSMNEENMDTFFEMLNQFQGRRLNDQRYSYHLFKRNEVSSRQISETKTPCLVQNEMSMSSGNVAAAADCLKSSDRSSLPSSRCSVEESGPLERHGNSSHDNSGARNKSLLQTFRSSRSVSYIGNAAEPDDLFDLIHRFQSNRIEDQRSTEPRPAYSAPAAPNPDTSRSVASGKIKIGVKLKYAKKSK